MLTRFESERLSDPSLRRTAGIVRKCVHCGLCTATCPTYLLLGDELDSPRGRIYLVKEMLEEERTPSAAVVRHVDRCLSCLACMTTCPADVHYMHLIDHARAYIEERYRRPVGERLARAALNAVLPFPRRFRLALAAARLARPLRVLVPGRVRAMLDLVPSAAPADAGRGELRIHPAQGPRRMRVALLAGCVQDALAPAINAATVRLLTRLGCEVVEAEGAGCCGALSHHLGKRTAARAHAARNIAAWMGELDGGGGLDAVVANASGCGTMLKDYGALFDEGDERAAPARRIAGLARDVSEVIAALGGVRARAPEKLRIAYHSACSLQHGQRLHEQPRALLAEAGFEALEVPEGHICCGSAGTYNLLQSDLARRLKDRKLEAIASLAPDAIAAGNIGCIAQLASAAPVPVLHTVELLDWAAGGPRPAALGPASADKQS